ncbi:hypothetical protein EUGRSUZ_B00049 [Eucalyptus grandis]|uniref:Uncharacterized protein n=2 Tax=Eucalyptus grandis TaxID=71139 RepID=A0ACC3KHA8_EUCGR|nr:hypothetical protein EUGRSUZ_B00049 [Eucalyptus grandis]
MSWYDGTKVLQMNSAMGPRPPKSDLLSGPVRSGPVRSMLKKGAWRRKPILGSWISGFRARPIRWIVGPSATSGPTIPTVDD